MLRCHPNCLPILFHNLTYNANSIVTQLGYDTEGIFTIPYTEEKLFTSTKCLAITSPFSLYTPSDLYLPACDSCAKSTRQLLRSSLIPGNSQGSVPICLHHLVWTLEEPELPDIAASHNRLPPCTDTLGGIWICNTSILYQALPPDHNLDFVDVLEKFLELCLAMYGVDCVWHISVPEFLIDVMLRKTGVELELLVDYDIHLSQYSIHESSSICLV
ncbi:hypothetical protein PR048_013642 [Dryococelus australis]|uniref:Uncharacterized protein n=1 Tax=Dryococelus australis TaxID=614101 RepID=A0ABQ9HSS6_9NEOP|nr:hypothetical protein PR048_013642 [Dryococelus australis]